MIRTGKNKKRFGYAEEFNEGVMIAAMGRLCLAKVLG